MRLSSGAFACVLFAAACTVGGVSRVTPEGDVIAENLLLPGTAGIYRMYDVQERGGTLVRYVPPDSLDGRLPPIDVSVYRVRHSLEEEVAIIRAGTRERDNSAIHQIDGTVYHSEGPFVVPQSGDTVYRAVIDMRIQTTPHRNMMYIHQEGGRYVNVSTTFVRVRGLDLEQVFDQAMSEIVARTRVAPTEPDAGE